MLAPNPVSVCALALPEQPELPMTSRLLMLLSRPVLPIGNGCGQRHEIDERARDVWLVELARDWGRRRMSRVGV